MFLRYLESFPEMYGTVYYFPEEECRFFFRNEKTIYFETTAVSQVSMYVTIDYSQPWALLGRIWEEEEEEEEKITENTRHENNHRLLEPEDL